jgi:hypothetical protein
MKPSPRGFAHTLLLGSLFAVAAMTMQNAKLHSYLRTDQVHRPILMPLVHEPLVQAPSVFEEEAKLSHAQLLERWDGEISEASRRFQGLDPRRDASGKRWAHHACRRPAHHQPRRRHWPDAGDARHL